MLGTFIFHYVINLFSFPPFWRVYFFPGLSNSQIGAQSYFNSLLLCIDRHFSLATKKSMEKIPFFEISLIKAEIWFD